MTLQEYLTSLRHKTVAVIGIGVSNTPLLRRLLAEGIAVTACDRSSREKLGPLADELEAAGATLQLGEGYLDGLTQDDMRDVSADMTVMKSLMEQEGLTGGFPRPKP